MPYRSVKAGDRFIAVGATSGGYGDPLQRDPYQVLEDARDGYYSVATAERDYGVIITESLQLDEAATEACRRARAEAGSQRTTAEEEEQDAVSTNSQQTPKPRRTYASFFDWPNKLTKERGIVGNFNEALAAAGEDTFQSFTSCESDPPDCIAINTHGNKIGIEITELVSQGAIDRHLKGEAVYRDWQQEQVIDALQDIIRAKDHKCRNVSGVSRLLLLIHTDEPVIDYEAYRLMLEHHTFETPQYFDEVILLFSYDPRQEAYPYVRLGFPKAD